jgi:hypothetical protein
VTSYHFPRGLAGRLICSILTHPSQDFKIPELCFHHNSSHICFITVAMTPNDIRENAFTPYSIHCRGRCSMRQSVLDPTGRPVENGFYREFQPSAARRVSEREWYSSLEDVRQKLAKFREHCNHQQPHSALA